jgi:hypothetical protein
LRKNGRRLKSLEGLYNVILINFLNLIFYNSIYHSYNAYAIEYFR